jgi:hypothetical protein
VHPTLGLSTFAATVAYDVIVDQVVEASLTLTDNNATVNVGTVIDQTSSPALTLTDNNATLVFDVIVDQELSPVLILTPLDAKINDFVTGTFAVTIPMPQMVAYGVETTPAPRRFRVDLDLEGRDIYDVGSLGIGISAPDASASLDMTSTAKGFLPPRLSEVDRDAISTPAAGLVIYNTDDNVLNFFNGSVWGAV